jgi:hypothetical protein
MDQARFGAFAAPHSIAAGTALNAGNFIAGERDASHSQK